MIGPRPRRRPGGARRRTWLFAACAAAASFLPVATLAGLVGAGPSAAGRAGARALVSPSPPSSRPPSSLPSPSAPRLRLAGPAVRTVPGAPPVLAWPSTGQGAVLVDGVGLLGRSPAERPVPIASLTKLMTAYVVLHDHPLAPGQSGPSLRMTGWDVADWRHTVAEDGSNVEVRVGEVLTERQLLAALLLPSADNLADTLAAWDAGTQAAFVAKMNATARTLGLSATHYADASGLDPASRSDAADQARLAVDLLAADPVVRELAGLRSFPFPLVGEISNVNPALGVDGIVGLKSGLTDAAGGCLVAVASRRVAGRPALLVAVTLGQPHQLVGAARAAEALLVEAGPALEPVRVSAPHQVLAWWTAPGRPSVPLRGPADPTTVIGWPGLRLTQALRPAPATEGSSPAAVLQVDGPAGPLLAVPLLGR